MRRLLALGLFGAGLVGAPAEGQSARSVYVAQIDGMIDMGLAPFVQRVLADAARDSAAAVVFDINTFGGRLDAAVAIRDAILSTSVPTVAFINRRAISAGALIALATERIAMTDGGTIGAATPVQMSGAEGETKPVEEKTVSYVRKEFRATAESRKRPIMIAEAMVDADVEIPGLIAKGKLLTLSSDEAITHRIADFKANTLDGVLQHIGAGGAKVIQVGPNWAETIVRFLTGPIISSLLLTVGMLGIVMEVRTPGFGFPGAIGLSALGLFLGGHWIVQLAGWEEMIIIAAGLILIGLELFVIPGFGIAGILGILALLSGLTMSLLGDGAATSFVIAALGRVAASVVISVVMSLFLVQFIPRTKIGRGLVLDTGMHTAEGWASPPAADRRWQGKTGQSQSPLRPAGIAVIDGERVDVVSEGELIEAGAPIVVSRIDGNRIVVRRHS